MFRAIFLTLAVILLTGCDAITDGVKAERAIKAIKYHIECDSRHIGVSTYYPDMRPGGFLQVYLPDRSTQYISTEGCSFIDVKRLPK